MLIDLLKRMLGVNALRKEAMISGEESAATSRLSQSGQHMSGAYFASMTRMQAAISLHRYETRRAPCSRKSGATHGVRYGVLCRIRTKLCSQSLQNHRQSRQSCNTTRPPPDIAILSPASPCPWQSPLRTRGVQARGQHTPRAWASAWPPATRRKNLPGRTALRCRYRRPRSCVPRASRRFQAGLRDNRATVAILR